MSKKKKAPVKYVNVDLEYGPAESWHLAKVIDIRMVKNLFDDNQQENLLVEICGGERIWVSFWEEINSY